MSLHDEYARVTPYEMVFREGRRVADLVDGVEEESERRGIDATELSGFLTLGAVEAFVREVAGDDAEADPGALHRFGPLAFHGVHFATAGTRLYLMTTHVARYLVEGTPEGEPRLPAEAGYVQLPQHLFWTRAAGEAPESVDGVFWSAAREGALHLLMVTGIRPDRPGVGVVPLPPGPLADAPAWVDVDAREDGDDFATDLPGAELDVLYEIRTSGELFKLLARFFAYVEGEPEALRRVEGERDGAARPEDDGPPRSALPFFRVTLDGS